MRPLQRQIIEALRVQPVIDPAKEVRVTINFLKDYLYAHPSLRVYVLGISGGQDSSLLGRIAQIAIEEIRQETEQDDFQFIGLRMPYGNQRDEEDAQEALEFINPDKVLTVNIKGSTDKMEAALVQAGVALSDYNKGNIKARQRMIVQYAVAGQLSGVVLGTDHAAESVTGFFTKFGDGSADLMPLWRLTKSQGRQMMEYLQAPPSLYLKVPVADLEDKKPMQPDEEVIGVTYQSIDAYLTGQRISDQDAEIIEQWYFKTQHKRHLPITVFDDFWK